VYTAPTIPSPTKTNTNTKYLNKQVKRTSPGGVSNVRQYLTSTSRYSSQSIKCTYSLGTVKYVRVNNRCARNIN
jgi:hypothetical protein